MDKGILVDVKASIRSLVIASNYSMTIQDVQRDFKTVVGYPLPYTQLGYHNAEQLLRALPDVVRISGYGPQALVYFVPNKKSEHIADLVKNQKVTTNKRRKRIFRPRGRRSYPVDMSMSEDSPEELAAFGQLNINDVKTMTKRNETCSSSTSSIDESERRVDECAASKQHDHENQIKRPIAEETSYKNKSNTSHSSLDAFTQKSVVISKRFNITCDVSEEPDDNCSAVEPHKKTLNSTSSLNLTTTSKKSVMRLGSRCFPIKETHNTYDDAIPENAVTDIIENLFVKRHEDKISLLEIPPCKGYEELKKGSVISLYIYEIHNPLIFFFHIDKEDHELIKLEGQMQEFYSVLTCGDLIMPDSYLQPGRFCAAKNDNTWYRAKILSVPTHLNDFSKIKLLFVDYGCVNDIPIKHVKLLASRFFCIPIQAARGRLYQIKPNEHVRSARVTNYFASLVNERCLYAYVANMDNDIPLMDLILIDTSVQPKCNINKMLIANRFAEKEETIKQ